MYVYNLVLVENSGSGPNFAFVFIDRYTPNNISSSFQFEPFDGYYTEETQYYSWISCGIN